MRFRAYAPAARTERVRLVDLLAYKRRRDVERAGALDRLVELSEDLGLYSRCQDVKKKRGEPAAETRAGFEQDLALGQLIYDLRTEARLSQRELAKQMGTTQSVISRREEGGGARNRIDTPARVATALERHLIVSSPEKVR